MKENVACACIEREENFEKGIIRIGDIVELGVFLSARVPFLLLSFAFPSCIEHFFIHTIVISIN